MLFIKKILDTCFKKKLFYRFIDLFEIKNIIDKQIYYLRFFEK